jgi:hypothetical protein
MAHPLQPHFDLRFGPDERVEDCAGGSCSIPERREAFDEYPEANELELPLHSACDALPESPSRVQIPSGKPNLIPNP